ncbi:hypothetical protein BIY23_01975 [Wolbachia pipientis]|uniref:Uncharacterized protein n=1 Tax=Wolbachia pipientis TaxID=955 RepID=A0A1E7QJX3_WOLPI|nr:hypothetical protein [Wolbachia pipientis]OEY86782.1 hypothetical protein BIY23_01975 [Wolbachia pipientis]
MIRHNNNEYFNNNGSGFDKPHVIKISDLNIKVEVYHNNLKVSKISKIESDIKETVVQSKSFFNLNCNDQEQVVKVYIFDDRDDYKYLGGIGNFNLGLGDEGGKFYKQGISGLPEIYVYQQGDVHNLKHELAHFLTHLATNGESLPTVLSEGIADYFEHSADYKFGSQGSSIDVTQDKNLTLSEILKLEYSGDSEQNSLVYKTGHALVMYLQESEPYLLKNFIDSKRLGDIQNSEKFFNKIIESDNHFKNWLDANNTDVAMRDINALHVTKGEFIATKKETVDGEIKNVSYYKANIDNMKGENVGDFSHIEHISFCNYARAINKATNDYLDISKEYHFLKVIKNNDGEYRLIYCDKQGNDYRDTENYKAQAFMVIANHDEHIKRVVEKFNKISKQYTENQNDADASYEAKYRSAYEKFNQYKNNAVKDYSQMLEELITINPSLIGNIPLQEGTMFSIRALGQGMTSALSVYDENDTKIGELLSEVGFFKQVEDQNKDSFFFSDTLHNMHVKQDGGAYIGITKENGSYKASFIDGRTVKSDEYFNVPHLHENELLNPSIRHIKAADLDSLQLQNIKILSHKNSQSAQYSEQQMEKEIFVEKGKLLDSKGTDRTDDDVYEAIIKQETNPLYTFKNIGFYLTEEIRDVNGKVVNDSELFIHDYGKNIRFQFPKSITHLKLVRDEGKFKLVPCTKDGNENPGGMPDVSDEYRYIDPIFAHEYEKRDYSHKHVNIGLINFDKYKPGTLFNIKFDPNDYQIRRNSDGEIIRTEGMIYFTKVKVFHDTEEIGMLSNSFHKFQDKIFFSADYNYSYNDFLASVSPQVHIESMQDGNKKIIFNQGKGDIGETDNGYTDYQRIFFKEEQATEQNKVLDTKQIDTFTETAELFRAKRSLEKNYADEMEGEKLLFPNREDLVINDNFMIEIKYGELISYTLDDIKQTIRAAYEVWCNEFCQQKGNNGNTAKLQLYIFKNYDDYKKYIKEFSGKTYDELWGGGTVRTDEDDGIIAKTFVFANAGNLSCAKSGYIMEKMSDAFLEYATGDFNKVPEFLRTGMKLFMYNYNLDKKDIDFNPHYIKAAYDKMQGNSLHDMVKDYMVADCLVKFLQEKHPYLINKLLSEVSFNKIDFKTEILSTGDEFKEWMNNASGYHMIKELVPHSETILLASDKFRLDIRYDTQELDYYALRNIKDTISSTIKNFKAVFAVGNYGTTSSQINLYLFNTQDDYTSYLKKLNIFNKDNLGLTIHGHNSNIHIYLYLQDQQFFKTLKHELGHALTIINSYYGAGDCLPIAMHEGIANYIANIEDGKNINNHVDIDILSTIKDKDLKPDEILNNNDRGKHYYSEAEQVIRFLEDRHPDLLNGLINALAKSGTKGKELVEDFMKDVKDYNREFSDWVTEQVDRVHSKTIIKRSLDHETHEHDTPAIIKDTILRIQKSYDQDSQGKHKVCIVIDYNDIKSLYDKAAQTEKSAVLEFWNKLHKSNYQIGILPEEKYYFKEGKFVIHDKKYTEDQVYIKILKHDDHYNLVLTNLNGNIIGNIDKNMIKELNYELTDNLFMDEHSGINGEYELYLANGLESIMSNEYGYDLI